MSWRQMFILKDGTPLLIREVTFNDASALNTLAAEVFGSTDQVLTSLEEFQSKNNLDAQIKRIKHYHDRLGMCIFVAELDGQLVGTLDFWNGHRKRIRHTGEFGMGVHPAFRDKGIGKCLIEMLLQWAQQNPLIEKVKLGVFASNKRGIHLYKKMGFLQEGRRVAEVKTAAGDYVDIIEMYKMVE